MSNKKIEKSIKKGISFLNCSQKGNGGFYSLSSYDRDNFDKALKYSTVFAPALILSCLCDIQSYPKELEKIKKKIFSFLISQKSEDWTFNYWERKSKESKEFPYPDDLDDTFCALLAIWKYNQKMIGADALAKIISVLTFLEEKEGGPYRTWLVSSKTSKKWKDVDLAVNCNIAYFLFLQSVNLDNVNKLVEKAIESEKYFSPYYPSIYPVVYYSSRFYKGKKKKAVVNFIFRKRKKDGSWGDSLNTALMISALLNFGVSSRKLQKSIEYVLKKQNRGKWEVCSFCLDPAISEKTFYSGSQELTSAFCLEALAKYARKKEENEKKKKDLKSEKIYEEVIKQFNLIRKKCFKNKIEKKDLRLEKIIKKENGKSVILLPYFFNKSLKKTRKQIPQKMIIQLGLANLLGWVSYTIYDDFLDEEGQIEKLPLANVCFRELTKIFLKIVPKNKEFVSFFQEIMNEIDAANFWEVKNCRFAIKKGKIKIFQEFSNYRNYKMLAKRSMGHSLGAMAILFFLGKKKNSVEVRNMKKFFESYIIARQISDDIHDWEEDLKKGQMSCVVERILRRYQKKKKNQFVDLKKDIEELKKLFWHGIVIEFCDEILKNVRKARKAYSKECLIKSGDFFEEMISPLEKMAQKTIREQKEVFEFLNFYSKKI